MNFSSRARRLLVLKVHGSKLDLVHRRPQAARALRRLPRFVPAPPQPTRPPPARTRRSSSSAVPCATPLSSTGCASCPRTGVTASSRAACSSPGATGPSSRSTSRLFSPQPHGQPVFVDTHADVAAVLADLASKLYSPTRSRSRRARLRPRAGRGHLAHHRPPRASATRAARGAEPPGGSRLRGRSRRVARESVPPDLPRPSGGRYGREHAPRRRPAAGPSGSTRGAALRTRRGRASRAASTRTPSRGRARLTIRVAGGEEASDRALALPWELLMPEPSGFAVAQGDLDLVREAAVDGAPVLAEPTEPLALAVSIAAPVGAGALRYEDEAFRLYQSLAPLGHRVAFADLPATSRTSARTASDGARHGDPLQRARAAGAARVRGRVRAARRREGGRCRAEAQRPPQAGRPGRALPQALLPRLVPRRLQRSGGRSRRR